MAALPSKLPVMVPAVKFPLPSRLTRVSAVLALVALLPKVIAPVPPDTVTPPPAARLVTPALLRVTLPPRDTLPPPLRPVPAVRVREELPRLALATAPGAILAAVMAPSSTVVANPAFSAAKANGAVAKR